SSCTGDTRRALLQPPTAAPGGESAAERTAARPAPDSPSPASAAPPSPACDPRRSHVERSAEEPPRGRGGADRLHDGESGGSHGAAGDADAVEPAVVGCEPVLVGLVPAQQGELPDAVVGRAADRVREKHHAQRLASKLRVAARLVERLDAAEPEAVLRCDGPPVELQDPEAQP